jgi:hypothetical protein
MTIIQSSLMTQIIMLMLVKLNSYMLLKEAEMQ